MLLSADRFTHTTQGLHGAFKCTSLAFLSVKVVDISDEGLQSFGQFRTVSSSVCCYNIQINRANFSCVSGDKTRCFKGDLGTLSAVFAALRSSSF